MGLNATYDRYNLITAENRLVSQYAQPSNGVKLKKATVPVTN